MTDKFNSIDRQSEETKKLIHSIMHESLENWFSIYAEHPALKQMNVSDSIFVVHNAMIQTLSTFMFNISSSLEDMKSFVIGSCDTLIKSADNLSEEIFEKESETH